MRRFKLQVLNIFFIVTTYFLVVTGLIIVAEFRSSAADNIITVAGLAVENPRPIAPRRDITYQRIAPLDLDSDLLPFWSR